ncbi:MAG: FAD-dependent oxidoreductase [Gammaproteobacteria bacterium]|nr:MAG: FAD-dependent oxidoreductase [Gammaproteobacteria bacterium]
MDPRSRATRRHRSCVTGAHPRVLSPARVAWEDGVPVAPDYGDIYFSRSDGVAESTAVFLDGNDLPQRWQQTAGDFCIGELGFGTGLSFLLARASFLSAAPASARLHFVSFERHPLASGDRLRLATQLAPGHPQLAAALQDFDAQAPPWLQGWHRLTLDGGRVRLALYYGNAVCGLEDWASGGNSSAADAWFLDGFAPARNPELWTSDLFAHLPTLSRPGATLGTFSVAAAVRGALDASGFEVERVSGPAGKRQVLRGRLRPGLGRPAPPRPQQVRILGAGLAGACCAAAFAARGVSVVVADPEPPATGASGNPWAVMHPRLPLDDGPRGPLQAAADGGSRSWLTAHAPGVWQPRPVIQLPELRRPDRLRRVLERYQDSGAWLAAAAIGDGTAIRFPRAGWADLGRLVATLLANDHITLHEHRSQAPLQPGAGEIIIVAAGAESAGLLPVPAPLGRMRGQLTRTRRPMPADAATLPIVTGRGHALALADGWVCGASYIRDGAADGPSVQESEDNLARLAHIQALLGIGDGGSEVCAEFVGIRCTVPDRSPLIGPVAAVPGLWVSTGHASAGLLTCPLAAELIAAAACGEPPVVDAELRALLAPDRFATP